jgi:hypothetical protein
MIFAAAPSPNKRKGIILAQTSTAVTVFMTPKEVSAAADGNRGVLRFHRVKVDIGLNKGPEPQF